MNPEIETLKARMEAEALAEFNWRGWRDEIARLHNEAQTEAEHIAIIEAHQSLLDIGERVFDPDTLATIRPIHRAEYKNFLNKESLEFGNINPVRLEYVTRREVEAGRLAPEDGLRELAVSGAAVLGDTAEHSFHTCRRGDWFCYGMIAAALGAVALQQLAVSPLWLIAVGFVIGYIMNEREKKRIKSEIAASRAASLETT